MNQKFIYAISLDQPFAHLIAHYKMNVESRQWPTNIRGTIAIVATQKKSKAEFDWVREQFEININPTEVAYASVVAVCNLVDVIEEDQVTRKTRKWFIGKYGFVLEDIFALPKPVPVKGNRKFWRLSGEALREVKRQVAKSPHAKRLLLK